MVRIGAEVGFLEESFEGGEAGLPVAVACFCIAIVLKVFSESQQALDSNGGGRAVDGFVVVVGFGGTVEVISEVDKSGSSSIPVGDSIGGGVVDIEVTGGFGGFEEEGFEFLSSAKGFEFCILQGLEEFQLLGET